MKPLIFSAIFILVFIQFCCKNVNNHRSGNIKITDQGVNISYTDNGKGDTVLLFVHGWCINKTYWTNQVNFFSKSTE